MRLVAGLLLLLSVLPAQETTIQVDAKLIVLNVYAEDKDGKPVTDLRREELLIYDGKKEEEIRVFTRQADGIARSSTPVPAGTYTNRIEAVPVAVTAVVIDQLNTPWQKQHYSRDLILRSRRASSRKMSGLLHSKMPSGARSMRLRSRWTFALCRPRSRTRSGSWC